MILILSRVVILKKMIPIKNIAIMMKMIVRTLKATNWLNLKKKMKIFGTAMIMKTKMKTKWMKKKMKVILMSLKLLKIKMIRKKVQILIIMKYY